MEGSSPRPRRRFPKHRRLLHRREFLWVQRKGKRYHVGDLIACVCRVPGEPTRVGLTTSKKVGKAVIRNRIRRLLREAVRQVLLPALGQDFAIVLIAKKDLSLELPQSQIDEAMEQLVDLIRRKPPQHAHVRAKKEKPE
ncbi:MAG: ribonuclease P protein component [Deltaproteobacteria bacterium]|nr:MAG: ribonuclease P protein component [Deltaproteobacteria bacterium]